MTKRIKIMTISDVPLSASGVALQTKYMIEALLQSGKFEVVSLGGAIKHKSYQPIRTDKYIDLWTIHPVVNFGNPDIIRSFIRNEKPDMLWFMTDPRFYTWLWQMEDEIRPLLPMVYYHVWDNYPYPKFNKAYYESTDVIATISKVTEDIVKTVAPTVENLYLPHAVDPEVFKKYPDDIIEQNRKKNFDNWENDKFLFFWNNRNARRKMSGSLVWWFKEFLDEVGHDKACLMMHTDPKDENGPNLLAIVEELGMTNGEIIFSRDKVNPDDLALMYNMSDCTINIADAEGFGLSQNESLACATPTITTMTGGLQEQVTDGKDWFGIGIKPASKAVIGSQLVPFIYEDRICKEDFIAACKKMLETPKEELKEMGRKGREHIEKNYSFNDYTKKWVVLLQDIHERYGSWDTRKNYKSWTAKEF